MYIVDTYGYVYISLKYLQKVRQSVKNIDRHSDEMAAKSFKWLGESKRVKKT